MLLQSSWLPSLLFIALATVNAYRPAILKPRYLTGTGISQPPSSLPLYPTGTANATIIPTGSSAVTATATPTLLPPTELFYLVVTAPGTTYDGNYLSVGSNTNRDGQLVLYPSGNGPTPPLRFFQFNLNADGTLQSTFSGGIAVVYSDATYNTPYFYPEELAEEQGYVESLCGVLDGRLSCQTGMDTVFYICPYVVISDTLTGGTVDVGVDVDAGCTGIGLLVVPV